MEEEAKRSKANKTPSFNSYGKAQAKPMATNFEDLMRDEAEREASFEKSEIPLADNITQPQFAKKDKKKKAVPVDDGLFWGSGELASQDIDEPVISNRDFPSLAKTAPSQKEKIRSQAIKRFEQQRRDAPIEWLAKKLIECDLEDEEAHEVASVIYQQPRQQMLDSIRSLVNDQGKASNIVYQFYRVFPRL